MNKSWASLYFISNFVIYSNFFTSTIFINDLICRSSSNVFWLLILLLLYTLQIFFLICYLFSNFGTTTLYDYTFKFYIVKLLNLISESLPDLYCIILYIFILYVFLSSFTYYHLDLKSSIYFFFVYSFMQGYFHYSWPKHLHKQVWSCKISLFLDCSSNTDVMIKHK